MPPSPSPARYSVLTVQLGQTAASAVCDGLAIDFTAAPATSSADTGFTVGGWVRIPPSVSNLTLFQTGPGGLQILVDAAGVVRAGFGGTDPVVDNGVSVGDGAWHFIGAAFQRPTTPSGSGTLGLYLDGVLVDDAAVAAAAPPVGGPPAVQLGAGIGSGDPADIASWTVWSVPCADDVMDVPQWGAPPAGSNADQGLAAAWDFAAGVGVDLGPNQIPISVAASALVWCTPCGQALAEATGFVPAAQDALNPGGAGAFTVMGWVSVPAGASAALFTTTLADPAKTQVVCVVSASQVAFGFAADPQTVPLNAPLDFGHVALTYDGAAFSLYIDGSLAMGPAACALPTASASELTLAQNTGTATVAFQALSIWTAALTAQQVAMAMAAPDPDLTGADGLAGYFSLMSGPVTVQSQTETAGLVNTVTWNSAAVMSNFLFQECRTPVPPQSSAASAAIADAMVKAARQPPERHLMRLPDWYALARRHGIDVAQPPTAADLAAEPYKSFADYYETLLAPLPSKLAVRLRRTALRNLHVGVQLVDKGVRAGTFQVGHQDGESVILYHAPDGPSEICRLRDRLMSGTAAVDGGESDIFLKIFLDVVGVIAAIVGFAFAEKAMATAAQALKGILQALGEKARAAVDAASQKVQQAVQIVFAVLYYTWNINALPTLAWKLVSQSRWWQIALNAVSLIGQLLAIVTSGGAYLAVKLTQMAIAFAQLLTNVFTLPPVGGAEGPDVTAA